MPGSSLLKHVVLDLLNKVTEQVMAKHRNQRSEDRVSVLLPVLMENVKGVTRDVSPSGICFEINTNLNDGSDISFAIEMEAFNEKVLLKCKGNIIRTEAHGDKTSVAVRITESVMFSV